MFYLSCSLYKSNQSLLSSGCDKTGCKYIDYLCALHPVIGEVLSTGECENTPEMELLLHWSGFSSRDAIPCTWSDQRLQIADFIAQLRSPTCKRIFRCAILLESRLIAGASFCLIDSLKLINIYIYIQVGWDWITLSALWIGAEWANIGTPVHRPILLVQCPLVIIFQHRTVTKYICHCHWLRKNRQCLRDQREITWQGTISGCTRWTAWNASAVGWKYSSCIPLCVYFAHVNALHNWRVIATLVQNKRF